YPGIRCRIRAGRTADRRLVDLDDLVQMLEAANLLVLARTGLRAVQIAGERLVQNLVHERRLARTRYTGNGREDAERNLDVQVLQVILLRPANFDPTVFRLAPLLRYGDELASAE